MDDKPIPNLDAKPKKPVGRPRRKTIGPESRDYLESFGGRLPSFIDHKIAIRLAEIFYRFTATRLPQLVIIAMEPSQLTGMNSTPIPETVVKLDTWLVVSTCQIVRMAFDKKSGVLLYEPKVSEFKPDNLLVV